MCAYRQLYNTIVHIGEIMIQELYTRSYCHLWFFQGKVW